MSNTSAEGVAYEVIANVRKGQKASLRQIIPKHGYALSMRDRPDKVVNTKAYQRVISPVVKQMEKIRALALKELAEKDLTKVQYSDLSAGVNKMTHDIQILSGGATENIAIKPLATLSELQNEKDGEKTI